MVKIYSDISWVINLEFRVSVGDKVKINPTISDEMIIGHITDIKEDVITIDSNTFGDVSIRKDIIEGISLVEELGRSEVKK